MTDLSSANVVKERLEQWREAMQTGGSVSFTFDELLSLVEMSIASIEAAEIMQMLVRPKRQNTLGLMAGWLQRNAPGAPCTALNQADDGATSHEDRATTAGPEGSPVKSTDSVSLPAQPPALPLSREERVCADRLADGARRMLSSFREHLGRCEACTINHQTLKEALGQWETVTR